MRLRLPAASLLVGLTFIPFPEPSTALSCAEAVQRLKVEGVTAKPVPLHRGDEVTVVGGGFTKGCDDNRDASAFGCSGDDEADGPTAMVDVELVILRGRQVAHQTSLSTSNAQDAETGRIIWTFTLPADYPLGPAFLKTEGSRALRVKILR